MDAEPQKSKNRRSGGLNAKRRMFCAEYLVDLNATKAAIRAGYSEATANQQGSRLLNDPAVQEEIQRLKAERAKRTELKADRVLEELKAMAFYDPGVIAAADIRGPAELEKLPEDVRRAIVGWSYDRNGNFTLKLASKTQQLELLGRHLRMFTDKVEHSGPDGGPIQTQLERVCAEAHSIVALVADIREQVKDPTQRKALIDSLPEEVREDAAAMDRIADIRAALTPPEGFSKPRES